MYVLRYAFRCTVLLFVFGCGGGGSGESLDCSDTEKSVVGVARRIAPEISADGQCVNFVEGPPVGISCLHCLQPEARGQAMQLADIMADSCRRNISTMMLLDGSFGDDQTFMQELVRRITSKGATLYLYVYFANGPWNKNFLTSPQKGFPVGMSPEEFRARIQSDEALRGSYQDSIRRFEPTFRSARDAGVILSIIPMLEDNLDASAARAMEQLVRESVSGDIPYTLGRNPCPGCYPGNDESIPETLFKDQHVNSSCHRVSVVGGLASNDGGNFDFPGEENGSDLTFDELFAFAEEAGARSTSFVLWSGDFQGRPTTEDVLDPAVRIYATPTERQSALLTEFLQTVY